MYQEDSFKTSQVVYAHTRSDEADMEYKMHCHNSYEIYYMVKGNVEYFLEGTSYVPKPGSLLIIPPNCFHGLRVLDGSEYHRIRLHFVPELLTEKEKKVVTLYYYGEFLEKAGGIWKNSSGQNGILIPWKNVDLIAGNCRILQFAHGSYRF